MRIFSTLVFLIVVLTRLPAQLQDGSLAPDFTAVDLNGQSRNLYETLEEGKIVVLGFMATWCPPCWAYHNSGALQDFYAAHGPDGDNRAEVFLIEGDPNTNPNCLYGQNGCNSFTIGNWVAGTDFPIFDHAGIAAQFEVAYYPTILIVCPNRKLYELGQLNAGALWEKAQTCPVASGMNNAGIFEYDKGSPLYEICGVQELEPAFTLINLGSNPLTSAAIELRWNNAVVDTVAWQGYLGTYGESPIQFDAFEINQPGQLVAAVPLINGGGDDDPANNTRTDQFTLAASFTTQQVLLKIRTDFYGAETYWELRDESGNVLDFGGNTAVGPDGGGQFSGGAPPGPGAYGNNVIVKDTLEVPYGGCYSIHFVDAYGDGMCCSYGNGYYRLYNLDNPNVPIISGGAFGANDDRAINLPFATSSAGPQEHDLTMRVFPNPASDAVTVLLNMPEAGDLSWMVTDLLGRIMESRSESVVQSGQYQGTLDVGDWPAGWYIVRVQLGEARGARLLEVLR
jgi:hypothetical protein